jgi:hypothetical protein
MNITPDAILAALRAEFPGFRVWAEPAGGRYRFVARRRQPGTGLHTVVTSDLAELRTALAAARNEQEPAPADRDAALPPPRHGRPAASSGGLPDTPQHAEVGGPDEPRAASSWPA